MSADVLPAMEHTKTQHTAETEGKPTPTVDAGDIAVSATELIEMIRAGERADVNELVRRTLLERHAA